MTRRGLLALALAVAAVGVAEHRLLAWWLERPDQMTMKSSTGRWSEPVTPFSTFLKGVIAAEQLDDPLRRCLAFPDPPGSHWDAAVVAAYCRYETAPAITLDEASRLIASGHAADLDRRLADIQHAPRSPAHPAGALDSIYFVDFLVNAEAARKPIDAWKKQSPRSAFALAASGMAYQQAGWEARGSKFAEDTPEQRFAEMHRLMLLAQADLQKARALDPTLVPTYTAAMWAAHAEGTMQDVLSIGQAALAIDPASFGTYVAMQNAALPQWGGSPELIRAIATHAQAQVAVQPLLALLPSEADASAADFRNCACANRDRRDAMRRVLDLRAATAAALGDAGVGAMPTMHPQRKSPQYEASVIYLAEAVRFAPWRVKDRLRLTRQLHDFGDRDAARVEADRAVAESPHSVEALQARAKIAWDGGDKATTEHDYLAVLSMQPDDRTAKVELAQFYAVGLQQWDKSWAISDELIRTHPEDARGWILRAQVQQMQPRPGLSDTEHYIVAHFPTDPVAGHALQQALEDVAGDGKPASGLPSR